MIEPTMKQAELPPEQLHDWLARGAAGDEPACSALYHHFCPAVERLALGLLGDRQDAEEVTQDAFVYALRNLARYDPSRSAFSTWLYTITLSRCRNKRRRKWMALVPLDLLATDGPRRTDRLVESLLERRGVRAQLWEALQALTPRLREAVALRYLAEMRYREIGETLGCNPKTAESRVRQGLHDLRTSLQAAGLQAEGEWAELWAA
jgi:RNA polymerase sigma-70 factor (ECF subfamily)